MIRLFEDENPNPQEWNKMKVGNVITTYNAGFFVLHSITRRFCYQAYFDIYEAKKEIGKRLEVGDEYSPLFNYNKIDLKTGKISTKLGQCDSFYCKPGIAEINKQINDLCRQAKILEDIQVKNHKANQ